MLSSNMLQHVHIILLTVILIAPDTLSSIETVQNNNFSFLVVLTAQ